MVRSAVVGWIIVLSHCQGKIAREAPIERALEIQRKRVCVREWSQKRITDRSTIVCLVDIPVLHYYYDNVVEDTRSHGLDNYVVINGNHGRS